MKTKKVIAQEEVNYTLESMQPGEYKELRRLAFFNKMRHADYYDRLIMSFLKDAEQEGKIIIGKKKNLPSEVSSKKLHANTTIVIKK